MPEWRLTDLPYRLLVAVCVIVGFATTTGLSVPPANADDERYRQIERSRGGQTSNT